MDDLTPPGFIEFGNLYDAFIVNPIKAGFSNLTSITGFASSAFAAHVLDIFGNISIKLIIGMARVSGIPESDHIVYRHLINRFSDRFHCYYYIGNQPIHAKAYVWTMIPQRIGFIGSPNFSWHGFGKYQEMAVRSDPNQILEYANEILEEAVSATSNIDGIIPIIDSTPEHAHYLQAAHGRTQHELAEPKSVYLSLLQADGKIHKKSGLNWGHRGRKNLNEAYIPVRSQIHNLDQTFFPVLKERFVMHTDDGENFVCVMAQVNRKAIETPEDNGLLGEYFRQRIDVLSGEFVEKSDLEKYGRTDIQITKIDDDLYYMDFSVSK